MYEAGEMSVTQAAAYLSVSERWVRQLLEDRRLRGRKEIFGEFGCKFRWIVEQTSVERYDVDRRDFEAILHARRVTWAKTQNERREQEQLDKLASRDVDVPYTREGEPDYERYRNEFWGELPESHQLGTL